MATPRVRRRRMILAAFLLVFGVSFVMELGARSDSRNVGPTRNASPSVSLGALPPGPPPVQLTADGTTFAPGACIAFPATASPAKGTVFLDAGHGGVDPGTAGFTSHGHRIQERSVTLAVVKIATEQLRAAGYRVVVSRWTDTTVDVPPQGDVVNGTFTAEGARHDVLARVACANASGAKLLVSVHMNAFGSSSEGGALTIYDPDRTFSSSNKRLATMLQSNVISALHQAGWPVPDRSILKDTQNHGGALTPAGARYGHEALLGPYARGWVSHPTHMPGAIIEPLFLTRPTEADVAYSATGQAVLARAIVNAVEQFLAS